MMAGGSRTNDIRTGSRPGSPAGQPGWGGGSDRLMAFKSALVLVLNNRATSEPYANLNLAAGRYRSRF
jgi:hypothetical protein